MVTTPVKPQPPDPTMQLFKLKEFCKLPVGTIFSTWISSCSDELYIKGETINDNDFLYWYLSSFAEVNKSVIFDDSLNRWAIFDEDEQFLVYDANHLQHMISHLQKGMNPPITP